MTQQKIDERLAERAAFQDLEEAFEHAKNEEYRKQDEFQEACDHRYPNGKSAMKGAFACSSCQICSYCDL